jgi:lipopolysaccharide/colanic/teichoic acid biosynthesis glycosyltransferase
VKRGFDLSIAATMLLVMAPALAAVALAVRLSSRGPIFFRQKRVGQHGRQFELLKFRTMMVNDDSDTMWSVQDDLRMTPIGRFLRRSCIDELPQVFNVIRGDMSLVGPRPERPYFDARFRVEVPTYADRLRGPVGITGWAQIHGLRGDTSIADRTRFDNFYIEHWSPWLDVVIMVRTLTAVLQWVLVADPVPAGASEVRAETVARSPIVIPVNAGTIQP